MPTARELLEQADALMRRNREPGEDVPVLTDVVEDAPLSPSLDDEFADVPVLTTPVELDTALPAARPREEDDSDIDIDADLAAMGPDFPRVRAEAIEAEAPRPEFTAPPARAPGVPMLELPPDTHAWRFEPMKPKAGEAPTVPASALGGEMLEKTLPLSELLVEPKSKPIEPQFFDIPPEAELRRAAPAAAAAPIETPAPQPPAPTAPPPPSPEEIAMQVQELTEQITLQVLQKLDIYTERGLQDHLSQHLKPVVERAVGDLVQSINSNVGRVIRAFVAESIEREIERFRQQIADAAKRQTKS